LIARYVVGLMYSRGLFEKYTPVNFTTFATPHLGVRHANRTFFGSIAETLGPRLISASGRQMFLADRSRRPLLLRMSDKGASSGPSHLKLTLDSIFIRGLALFKTRIAYSNIINDRSVPYHTAAITLYNPYLDMTKLKMCYVPSYSPVIVHPVHPIIPISNPKYTPPRLRFIWLRILVFTLLPLWLLFFTVVSIYQSFFSARRIKAHFQHKPKEEEQLEETTFSGAVQEVFEDVVDNSNVLPEEDEEYVYQNGDTDEATPLLKEGNGTDHDVKAISEKREEYRLKFNEDYETMFKGLRSLQWHAIGVHIHKSGHSHAAIIRRTMFRREELSEGVVVIEHWLKELFQT